MCGIFGGLSLSRPLGDETMRALGQLAHRGPDGEGVVDLGGAVLGHRRLSIIDLSHAADQPLWDAKRQAAIVFNGEIYNFRELRAECAAAGIELRSDSDTEAIVGQYLLHGDEAFVRLNGMFAFCLYDARTGTAYLVRDRFGIKPLYYARCSRGLLFSSELAPLLGVDGVDRSLDRGALQAYLQLDFVPTPYSIVSGVRKLDAGSFLRVDRQGAIEIHSFERRRAVPQARTSEPELLEELGRRIDAAVTRHLVSDVPVGVFLSGGIDSTLVAESAMRITGGTISTYSIAFEDRSFDESASFGSVAAALRARHSVRTLSADAMLELLPRVASMMGEPLADGSIYPTMLLSAFVREEVTVALSGDGADELFAGYPTYFGHSIARRLPGFALRALQGLSGPVERLVPARFENLSPDYKLKKFLNGLEADMVMRHVRWMGTFTKDEMQRLLIDYDHEAQVRLEELLQRPAKETGDGWLEQVLRTDQRFYLQDGVLVKVDLASMASSLEVRVPFLDREVVDFADALPAAAKMRRGTSKRLLRRLVEKRFPPEIARRPKKGFGAPLGRWFRGELRPLLEERLSPAAVRRCGIFQPDFVQRLLADHWSGARDNRKQIFNLLSFAMWQEAFGVGSGG